MSEATLSLALPTSEDSAQAEPRFLGTRWPIVLWRVWIALALALTIRFAIQPTKHTVIPIYAEAAHRWWQDQSLYKKTQMDYFRYPPLFAILFTPLSLLGPVAGAIAWSWLSLGALLVGLYRFERDVLPGQRNHLTRAILFLLTMLGSITGLWNGQVNALIVGMVLLGGRALVREQWWSAALWIAGTVALKLTTLPILLLVLALWFRPMWWRALIVLVVAFLSPFLTRPPHVVLSQFQWWIEQLQSTSGERWPGFRDAWTIWIVFEHQVLHGLGGIPDLKEPLRSNGYRCLQIVSGGAVLLWCLSLRRLSERWKVTFVLAMGMGWLMLLGPATEHPTYVFLAPFLAWGFVERKRWPAWSPIISLSAGLILILGWRALTVEWWAQFPWLLLALPLGSVAFLTWLMAIKQAQNRASSSMHFS